MSSASFRSRLRRPTPAAWIAGAVFLGALVARSVWLPDAFFHPDESTLLWMALDAVRDPQIPDHGLISSYHVSQPPGLVWMTMPWVALGGGRPELVIVGFALLNARRSRCWLPPLPASGGSSTRSCWAPFSLSARTRFWSTWVWHVSLYTAAVALLMAAGVRLRQGSAWWALALVAAPGLYSLIHYSGFVLFAPALVLLLWSRRTLRSLAAPVLSGVVLIALAWGPFLSFQVDREWVDVRKLTEATGTSSSVRSAVDDRVNALDYAVSHLGQSYRDSEAFPVHLTRLLVALVVIAFLVALIRRRWRDPGFAVPAAVLAAGLAAQVALGQGERADVLMLWHVPLYALAAWAVVQLIEVARFAVARMPSLRRLPRHRRARHGRRRHRPLRSIAMRLTTRRWPRAGASPERERRSSTAPPTARPCPRTLLAPVRPPVRLGLADLVPPRGARSGSGSSAAAEAGAFRSREDAVPRGSHFKRDSGRRCYGRRRRDLHAVRRRRPRLRVVPRRRRGLRRGGRGRPRLRDRAVPRGGRSGAACGSFASSRRTRTRITSPDTAASRSSTACRSRSTPRPEPSTRTTRSRTGTSSSSATSSSLPPHARAPAGALLPGRDRPLPRAIPGSCSPGTRSSSATRPDPDLAVDAREGAEGLFRSLQRLLELEDGVEVYPGHVAGSLCGKAMSSKASTTIGFERRFNRRSRRATSRLRRRVVVRLRAPAREHGADRRAEPRARSSARSRRRPSSPCRRRRRKSWTCDPSSIRRRPPRGSAQRPGRRLALLDEGGIRPRRGRRWSSPRREEEAHRALRGLRSVAILDVPGYVLGGGRRRSSSCVSTSSRTSSPTVPS